MYMYMYVYICCRLYCPNSCTNTQLKDASISDLVGIKEKKVHTHTHEHIFCITHSYKIKACYMLHLEFSM